MKAIIAVAIILLCAGTASAQDPSAVMQELLQRQMQEYEQQHRNTMMRLELERRQLQQQLQSNPPPAAPFNIDDFSDSPTSQPSAPQAHTATPADRGSESVEVKYRGAVNLAPFDCRDITRSSFIKRVCYDRNNEYMLINLKGTYYHYCEIDDGTVTSLLSAESMGRFYNATIKGQFDCRVRRVPSYEVQYR